jgi:Pyridoxamine 5'-phosphate oxidase
MGKTYDGIDDALAAFIARQHVFFVATAPRADEGLLNLSPKGGDSFRVLGPHLCAYRDLTGSGVETIAHVRENGRIVIMFCAFEGAPKILRLHGRGEVVEPGHAEYEALVARFPPNAGTRAVLRIEVRRVADACGYAVPLLEYRAERDQLDAWCERKGPEGLVAYRREKNAESIDGLPGLHDGGSAPKPPG